MHFSLVHCSARPDAWTAVYAQYVRTARFPECFEYILCFDWAQQKEFRRTVPASWFELGGYIQRRVIINTGERNYVTAANFATQYAIAPIILEVTDDLFPPFWWDQTLTALLPLAKQQEKVVWVNDGVFPSVSTMQIFTRKWYERYGYVFHPDFPSMNGDREFTWRANRDEVLMDVRDNPKLRWDHQHHRNLARAKDASDTANESAERYCQGWKALNRHCPGYMKNLDPIDALYASACAMKSDIAEHLPQLKALAAGKEVLELGTRAGNSTIAFLAGRPKRLVSVDLDFSCLDTQVEGAAMYSEIPFEMKQQDSREVVGDFDVIFFDTVHTYTHLKAEIAAHAPHARERLVFHDTVTNADASEDGSTPGLMAAINELVSEGAWEIESHALNNNGLLILRPINRSNLDYAKQP